MIGTYRKVVVYTLTLIIARLPSIMYASDITGLTATANGYTWTYTLFDGNTAGLVSCTPEPEGRLIIPSGLDIEVLKNGVLITHVPVSSIEKGCFENCDRITSVEFPNTANFYHVRANAFSGCTNLSEIKMNSGLASIGKEAFKNCTSLTEVVIPEDIGSIGDSSFSGCSGLLKISLPCAALTSFYYGTEMCVHVGSIFGSAEYEGGIVLKQRSKSGSDSSFCFPENLSEITATGTVIPSVAFRFRDTSDWLKKLTIGSNVKRIGMNIVGNCSRLSEIEVPSSVSYVSQEAFSGCGLRRAVVNSGDLDMWAFAFCYRLESISLREGVTSIAYDAFDECTNLVSVVIPNSVTNIGNAAFEKCYNLRNVSIGEGIKSISYNMFNSCSSLEHVNINGSVTNIRESAFSYCTSLSSITIPSSVERIETKSFYRCNALKKIIFSGNAPQTASNSFGGISSTCVAYVRYGSTGWGDGDSWQGMSLQYYGANVSSGSAIEIDDGYSIVATGGSRIIESDIAITAPLGTSVISTKPGYIVEIADDGMSATVSLRKPELLTPEQSCAEDDKTGVLAVIDETEISAKPELLNGEEIGAIMVNAVPGLYYQAAWGDDIGNLSKGEKVQASTENLYLGVIKQTGTAGFYKITVSDR